MARNLYLVRHGWPALPGDGHCCLGGKSSLPLSEEGRRQAGALAECFGRELPVYSSPLAMSLETARIIAGGKEVRTNVAGLGEIDVGEWEGMNFRDIRKNYPQLYAQRGRDWSIPPAGGESLENAAQRIAAALKEILRRESRSVVVVTHDGAIRALRWKLEGLDTKRDAMIRQPYGSLSVLSDVNGALRVTAAGKLPADAPADEELEEFWELCGVSAAAREYSLKICELCLMLRERLRGTGLRLSQEQLRAAALLQGENGKEGEARREKASALLCSRGYPRIARILLSSEGGAFETAPDEALLLCFAGKLAADADRGACEEDPLGDLAGEDARGIREKLREVGDAARREIGK